MRTTRQRSSMFLFAVCAVCCCNVLVTRTLVVEAFSTGSTSRRAAFLIQDKQQQQLARRRQRGYPSQNPLRQAQPNQQQLFSAGSGDTIVSPFDDSDGESSSSSSSGTTTLDDLGDGPFDLTWENVEMVLDSMRHFLIQDGGNVVIKEIDGPVVKLQLEGACGTCPSSTQTMKMGLERGLREKIPEIQEVIQAMPSGPELCEDQINVVLDGVRPFLQVAGGTIEIDRLEGIDGLQPTIWLDMGGTSATLNSVKLEIAQRLQRHFMLAGLRVEWVPVN